MFSDTWATFWWGVLSSPTQTLSGVGQGHLPDCNAQLPSWPPLGPSWPPAALVCDLSPRRGFVAGGRAGRGCKSLVFPPAHLDFLLASLCLAFLPCLHCGFAAALHTLYLSLLPPRLRGPPGILITSGTLAPTPLGATVQE